MTQAQTRKINVAVLIDAWYPFIGGGQVHVANITGRLSKKCRFTLYHSKKTDIFSRAIWSISVIPKLLNDHQKKKFDLIHAHAYISGLSGFILAELLRIPVIFTVHGCNLLDIHELLNKKKNINFRIPVFKYLLEKFLLTKIYYNHVISVSGNFLKHKNVNKNISVILFFGL